MTDDPLRAASEARAREAVRPLLEAVARVRSAADALEAAALEKAREDATAAMMAAVGHPFERAVDSGPAQEEMLEALSAVRTLLVFGSDLPDDPEPEVQPFGFGLEAAAPPDPSPVPAPAPPPREASPALLAQIEDTVKEFEGVRATYRTEHPRRLSLRLQISVAELRHLMSSLSVVHEAHHRMSECVRAAGLIKDEVPEIGFIVGLAHHHRRNWAGLAGGLRHKLARFDRDSSAPVSSPRPPPSVRDRPSKPDRSPMFDWPELPKLRAAIGRAPAFIVGGSGKDAAKLPMVHQRLGLVLEWEPVEGDNPRSTQSLADRIRSGGVSAVIVVNGFMAHKVWWVVQAALDAAKVPYAMAGKGGIGGIESAVREIEQKL